MDSFCIKEGMIFVMLKLLWHIQHVIIFVETDLTIQRGAPSWGLFTAVEVVLYKVRRVFTSASWTVAVCWLVDVRRSALYGSIGSWFFILSSRTSARLSS